MIYFTGGYLNNAKAIKCIILKKSNKVSLKLETLQFSIKEIDGIEDSILPFDLLSIPAQDEICKG